MQSNETFDIEYTYLVDDTLVESGEIVRGSFVNVPFGFRKQPQTAVVWTLNKKTEPGIKCKEILGISNVRPPLTEQEMLLASKMSEMYLCSVSACVRCMIPPDAPKGRQVNIAKLTISQEKADELASSGEIKNIVHLRILENLKNGQRRVSDLAKEISCTPAVFNTLVKRGYIVIEKGISIDDNAASYLEENEKISAFNTYDKHTLNEEQQKAFEYLWSLIEKKEFSECLLHGVTGSGKTEIYMQLISKCVEDGGSALLLVPEISLTPQMTAHFKNRFGNNVAVLHSRLSDKERNIHWNRIKNSEVSIAIGARSAIFAPFEKLRLIILDEEHETSYKSEDSAPVYHAAEVAEEIAKIRGATVIYGSATPRVETYYRASQKEIHYIRLEQRANKAPLPQVEFVDMIDERANGNMDRNKIFSSHLISELRKNYEKGKQAMLFVHRRGFARQLVCQSCGRTMKCSRCNMPMTYHEKGNRLICHHCGRTFPTPKVCPMCAGEKFEKRGIGTQRVVDELSQLFPDAGIVRMDTDTTSIKDGHEKLLAEFSSGKAQFLVGTQMIAKGHDFPNVTLVSILSADSLINLPDYRAQERAFQLFTQMAGRAGRGDMQGKVIIQAYCIDDYSLTAARNHDYDEFYRNEIVIRENLKYPPFSAMCTVRFAGEDDKKTYKEAAAFCADLAKIKEEREVLGPARADIPKVNNKYRWIVTIKGQSRAEIIALLQKVTIKGKISFQGR